MDLQEKFGRRKDQFKKGIDAEDARRKREDQQFELRRAQREDQLSKRRLKEGGGAADEEVAIGTAPAQPNLISKDELQQLVMAVNSEDPAAQLDATTRFRKLLSIERNPPIQQVIDTGVVRRLVQFLTVQASPQLQFEAAWALTNIASGTSVHTRAVVDANAVPIFIQLLRSGNPEVAEQAVWALGNIAGDSVECRDLVLRFGALQPLISLCLPNGKISLLRNATWTLSNLCRGKPQPDFALVSPALYVLANLIQLKDEEVLTDACWALSYLSDDTGPSNQKIQAVLGAGVARNLVDLLMHPSPNVRTPALRTVGNIVTGDDMQTQVILANNALPALSALLSNSKKGIRKEACWTISNITAGNPEQIQQVIDHNIIPQLLHLLRKAEFDIKKEAAWAISNATSGGTDEQIRYLVEQGAIAPLCDLFVCGDPKIILVALEGIENILKVGQREAQRTGEKNKYCQFVEACNGLDKLEDLQNHQTEEIYAKAQRILHTYFELINAEQVAAPTQNMGQFNFQPPAGGAGGFNF